MLAIAATALTLGLASGCDDGQSADAHAPFSEFFFSRTANGWGRTSERSSDCAPSSRCSKARATASNRYACGETHFLVDTLNNDTFRTLSESGIEPEDVTVRGRRGHLWKLDSADFELIWRETRHVEVRISAEDVTHSTPEILSLARRLSERRWRDDASTHEGKPVGDNPCGPLTGFR
jgi:hypothetical protein